ncbi:MAG: hypothetical protein IPI11_18400 [Haliscomenobacter sp.]|nr:hypothetical protein [Haliscomenobacter sp.]
MGRRVIHLDFAPPNAIENPLEMDETLEAVLRKLNRHGSYPGLFKKAFPELDTITTPYLLYALSNTRPCWFPPVPPTIRYQLGKGSLTEEERQGLDLFKAKCATCHSGALFTNQDYANNGLDTVFPDRAAPGSPKAMPTWANSKVPSLRNVAHRTLYARRPV